MQTSRAKYIKGLSIAVIVLAALGILGAFASFALTGVTTALIGDYAPSAFDEAYDYGYTNGLDYQYGMDGQETADLMATMVAMTGTAISIWVLLCHVVMLVAGIIGLRFGSKPSKLKMVFGWSIAGAIASLLSCSFVSMVLLIIMAVFAYKDRAEAVAATSSSTAQAQAAVSPSAAPIALNAEEKAQ